MRCIAPRVTERGAEELLHKPRSHQPRRCRWVAPVKVSGIALSDLKLFVTKNLCFQLSLLPSSFPSLFRLPPTHPSVMSKDDEYDYLFKSTRLILLSRGYAILCSLHASA